MKIFSLSLLKVEKDLWFFVFFPVVHLCLRKRYKFSPDALHEQFATKELFFSPPSSFSRNTPCAAKWKPFSHSDVSTFTCSSLHTTNESGSVVKSLVSKIYWHFFIILSLHIEIYFNLKLKLNIKAIFHYFSLPTPSMTNCTFKKQTIFFPFIALHCIALIVNK